MGMEPGEGPKANDQPVFSRETIDSIAENAILGKHTSLFGPNTASQQFPPKDAEDTLKILQREDPSFREKVAPFARVMLFATTSLGRDSKNRIQDFLRNIEEDRIKIRNQTNQLAQGVAKGRISDPDLAADAILAIKAAVLLGYSAPVDILDTFAHKWRWGSVVFPELLMGKDFRESRKNLLDEVRRIAKQYAEYTENPDSANVHNIGPADIMKGGTYETIKLLNGTKDFSGLEVLSEYANQYKLSLKNDQADDPLGLNYAVLKGFLMAQTRFENATRLYQTMTNVA